MLGSKVNCNQLSVGDADARDSVTKSMSILDDSEKFHQMDVKYSVTKSTFTNILDDSRNLSEQVDTNDPERWKPSVEDDIDILDDHLKKDNRNDVLITCNNSADSDFLKHSGKINVAYGIENIPTDLEKTSAIPIDDNHYKLNGKLSSSVSRNEKKKSRKRKGESTDNAADMASTGKNSNQESATGKEPPKDSNEKNTVYNNPSKVSQGSKKNPKQQPTDGDTTVILDDSKNLPEQMGIYISDPERCQPLVEGNVDILNDHLRKDNGNGVVVNGNNSAGADSLKLFGLSNEVHEKDHVEEHEEGNRVDNMPADLCKKPNKIPVEDYHQILNGRPASPVSLPEKKKRNRKRKQDSTEDDTKKESAIGKEPSKDQKALDTSQKQEAKDTQNPRGEPDEDIVSGKPLHSATSMHETAAKGKREKTTSKDKKSSKSKQPIETEKCNAVEPVILEMKKPKKTPNKTTGDSHLESLEFCVELGKEMNARDQDSSDDSRRFRVAIRKVSKRRAEKSSEKTGSDQSAGSNGFMDDGKFASHNSKASDGLDTMIY